MARVEKGINDLATLKPELVEEWDFERNGIDLPEHFTCGSGKKVWWKGKCGHEWFASIYNRTSKASGCPECAKKSISNKNILRALGSQDSLAKAYPKIAEMWDFELNKEETPEIVVPGSAHKVWWRGKCGHSWQRVINYMIKYSECPYCTGKRLLKGFNDLETLHPEICKEWNYSKNEMKPTDYLAGSGKRVWWICNSCGNEWRAQIAARVSTGSLCPKCARGSAGIKYREAAIEKTGTVEELYPDLLSEWDYDKNTFLPSEITPYSDIKVWWLCDKCGHSWKTGIRNRTKLGSRCPSCVSSGTSFPEQTIYYYVKKIFQDAQNRYREFNSQGVSELDIWLPSIRTAIEYDGLYYHRNKEKAEREKDNQCKALGIRLLRVKEIASCKQVKIQGDTISYEYCGVSNMRQIDEMVFSVLTIMLGINIKSDFVDVERDQNDILQNMRQYERENSLAAKYPEIAKEWHPTKNGKLIPENFTVSNGKKIWWKCSVCGHEWRTTIASRTAGTGCNVCRSKQGGEEHVKTLIARNGSLKDVYPELVNQWHPTKNGTKTPADYTCRSGEKVWWICSTCGGEWDAVIASRSSGVGCPFCSGQRTLSGFNDLLSQRPNIAKDWDYGKNDSLPQNTNSKSSALVSWKCTDCGWEWQQAPLYNINGCPKCYKPSLKAMRTAKLIELNGSLVDNNPQLATEWHPTKNGDRKPQNFTENSGEKVWWKCSKCNGEWEARIAARNKGLGCPYCANQRILPGLNDLLSQRPDIAKDWHKEKNLVAVTEISYKSSESAFWKCSECGYEWEQRIRYNVYGCPKCNRQNRQSIRRAKLIEEKGSLMDNNPELSKQWHPTKNGEKKPFDFTENSGERVWWLCSVCNGEWEATIGSRNNGAGCPFCANQRILSGFNDLLTLKPNIAKDWDKDRNIHRVDEVGPKSSEIAFWKCCVCGYEWKQRPCNNLNGCPVCNPKGRIRNRKS